MEIGLEKLGKEPLASCHSRRIHQSGKSSSTHEFVCIGGNLSEGIDCYNRVAAPSTALEFHSQQTQAGGKKLA